MCNDQIVLALAAGGARGAYQAGAMLFLSEQGIRFTSVAGTSIGSLNAAFYAQGDGSPSHLQQLLELWRTVPSLGVIKLSGEAVVNSLAAVLLRDIPSVISVVGGLTLGNFSILSPEPVAKLLDKWIDYAEICTSEIDLTVAVLPETVPILDIITGTWRKAVYLRARDIGPSILRQSLLAAGAIPLAFPSQKIDIDGGSYADAGLADPVPARYLYNLGHRHIISIFLSEITIQNRSDFTNASLLQIRPSLPIDINFQTTFDFSQPSIENLIDLGYKDAQAYYTDSITLFQDLVNLRESGMRLQKLTERLPNRHNKKSPFDDSTNNIKPE